MVLLLGFHHTEETAMSIEFLGSDLNENYENFSLMVLLLI